MWHALLVWLCHSYCEKMVYCAAVNCKNGSKKNENLEEKISLFSFPKDEKLRKPWTDKVARNDWKPSNSSRLIPSFHLTPITSGSDHFDVFVLVETCQPAYVVSLDYGVANQSMVKCRWETLCWLLVCCSAVVIRPKCYSTSVVLVFNLCVSERITIYRVRI